MSKLWGAVHCGAGPIGGVLPMDPASGVFEHHQAAKSRVTGPRVGARGDDVCRFFLFKLSRYISAQADGAQRGVTEYVGPLFV